MQAFSRPLLLDIKAILLWLSFICVLGVLHLHGPRKPCLITFNGDGVYSLLMEISIPAALWESLFYQAHLYDCNSQRGRFVLFLEIDLMWSDLWNGQTFTLATTEHECGNSINILLWVQKRWIYCGWHKFMFTIHMVYELVRNSFSPGPHVRRSA